MAGGQDVRQLLLQVDASVALAQRNLGALRQSVDRDTAAMDASLKRPEDALDRLSNVFRNFDQVMVASSNQQRAFGLSLDQATAKELQSAQAISQLARALAGYNPAVQIATREQLAAAAAIGTFAAATSRLEVIQRRGTASHGQYRAGMQQLGFQINDVATQLASGTSATQVFAQQSGQVVQSIQLMSGGASRFATFMGGPWGIALTAGAVVLLPLIARLLDSRTELEKATDEFAENARKTALNRQAQAAYGQTLLGVIDAIHAQTEALAQQNQTIEQSEQLALRQANANQQMIAGWRNVAVQAIPYLTQAAAAQAQANQSLSGDDLIAGVFRLNALTQQLRVATQALNSLNGMVDTAGANRRDVDAARIRREVDEGNDPRLRETGNLRREIDRLNDQLHRGVINELQYRQAYDAATDASRARTAQIERETEAQRRLSRETSSARDLVRPVTGSVLSPFGVFRAHSSLGPHSHAGVDLNAPVGTPVVAPGAGLARRDNDPRGFGWNIKIQLDNGLQATLAHLSGFNIPEGSPVRVEQGQVVGYTGGGMVNGRPRPGAGDATGTPHLHYELRRGAHNWRGGTPMDPLGRTNSSGAAQAAGQAAREAQRAQEQRDRDEADFRADMQRAGEQLLQARRSMAETVEQQLAIELDQIETDRQQALAASDEKAAQGHRTEADAQLYAIQQDMVAQARAKAARERAADAIAQQRIAGEQEQLQHEGELEQMAGQLAETRAEQLASALRLADLQRERELKEIEGLRIAARGNAAELARLDAREQFINESHDLQTQMIQRQNEGPLARRMRELRAGAADINTQLEELDVRAIDALDQSARNAVKSILGLHGALGDIVADLIMIFIRQEAIQLAGGIGGKDGGGGLISMLGNVLGLASAATGGGGGLSAGDAATLKWASPFGHALGGRMNGPSLVGERGPEIFIPDVPGLVIPNHMLGKGSGARGLGRIIIELPPELDARIAQVSGPLAVEVHRQMEPGTVAKAQDATFASLMRVPLS